MAMLLTDNKINIESFVNSLFEQERLFAIFRRPFSNTFSIFISDSTSSTISDFNLEELKTGFLFAPYNISEHPTYYISADYSFELPLDEKYVKISGKNCIFQSDSSSHNSNEFTIEYESDNEDNYQTYLSDANKIINHIKAHDAQKVVLSRVKKLGTLKDKNYYKAFKRLTNNYPHAFVSLVNLPSLEQVWLGASPEILVSYDTEDTFKTMSLAGTQSALDKNGNSIEPIDALWSHKEIEEQAMVSRYIINCLKKLRIREFEEDGPKTVKAGNLLHLRTEYRIDNKDVKYPNLGSVMLELLHPTPAVCGMPRKDAERILNKVEKHDREYYSGFLGPINTDTGSALFVNLRTMKVNNDMVYGFAGGGFTSESIPEREWLETEMKFKTICKAFSG